MNKDSKKKLIKKKRLDTPLTRVLEQSEHVKNLVEESVKELSSTNTVIRQKFANQYAMPEVENALKTNEAIKNKVQKAYEKLTVMNQVLEEEVRNREMLDHQFAASQEQEAAARHVAFHDVLTGLPNRALFNDRLEQGFSQAKRHGGTLAVMFMDLDKFKIINDTHGHNAGDSVLQIIAQRLTENIRGEDTVSRFGGDEFLFLLPDTQDENNISIVAGKILQAIQAPCHISAGGISMSLSIEASIGISVFPKDGTNMDALLKSADEAMYQAKQRKSGYAFAGQEPGLN